MRRWLPLLAYRFQYLLPLSSIVILKMKSVISRFMSSQEVCEPQPCRDLKSIVIRCVALNISMAKSAIS